MILIEKKLIAIKPLKNLEARPKLGHAKITIAVTGIVTVHGPKCLLCKLEGHKGILYRYRQGGKNLEDILLRLPFHP